MAFDALIIALLAGAGGATVARLLTIEHGPMFVFNDVRLMLENFLSSLMARAKSEFVDRLLGSAIEIIGCPICQSVWWSAIGAVAIGAMAGLGPNWLVVVAVAAPSFAWAIGNAGGWLKNANP